MSGTNAAPRDWCETLGIRRPDLAVVKDHQEANTYALLIVALLERGEAMTLVDVAERFAAAGVAPRDRARRSLQRCKPARAPVYRDGDYYAVDPHDDELDQWAFRLGLRPPKVPRLTVVRPEPPPLPGSDHPLSVAELDEAWADASLGTWSAQRLALAVLDAQGPILAPDEVVAFVAARTKWHCLNAGSRKFQRRHCPIRVGDDGRWSIAGDGAAALRATREAVRALLEKARRRAAGRPDPAVIKAQSRAAERRRAAHAAELAAMSRALLVGFPPPAPRVAALLDIGQHELATFVDDELDDLRERLSRYDLVGAQEVRALLRAMSCDLGDTRLAELGPPQKSKTLNRRGRKLKITTTLLVQGSCGISRPFGDPQKLAAYLARGEVTKLRRRLEADVKALYALYEYGRLHGVVRLRWGFLDERLPVPWVHFDEPTLGHLKRTAVEAGQALEVVVGNAPGWRDPWSRARRVSVALDVTGWWTSIVDEEGYPIDDADVQRARIAEGAEGDEGDG